MSNNTRCYCIGLGYVLM